MVASTMDLVGWLRKHLEAADTDLLREMVLGFVQALMGAEPTPCAALGWASGARSGSTSAMGIENAAWTLEGDPGAGHPKAAGRQLLPGLAVGAAPAG